MSERVRCGAIVGFGRIAEVAHVPALRAAGLDVVAVVEPSPARRDAAAVALPGVRVYADLAALWSSEALEFVDVCTPPHLHHAVAAEALRRGLHVLCEKPFVLSSAHARELAELARGSDAVVLCVDNWAHAPILTRAREFLDRGEIGPLREARWSTLRSEPARAATTGDDWRLDPARAGGGVLFDHGWHGISIVLGTSRARALTVRGGIERRGGDCSAVEDTAWADLELTGGVRARIETTWAADRRANSLVLHGEHGSIHVDDDRLVVRHGETEVRETFAESLAGGGYRAGWFAGVARQFRAEIDGRRASPARAIECVDVILGAYHSATRGGEPVALELA